MALKLKYKDEHGILHINMSPSSTPQTEPNPLPTDEQRNEITDPKFDTINNRFAQYDLFGGKYDTEGGDTPQSLFRSRYNSIEEELANTPYAFATERSLRLNNNLLDITIQSRLDEPSPSKDIEDDRYFNRSELFGPQIDFLSKSTIKTSDEEDSPAPAFTVTQLIHAQDRYFDLSSRQSSSVVDSPKEKVSFEVKSVGSGKERTVRIVSKGVESEKDEAFTVLSDGTVKNVVKPASATQPVVPISKRKRESSFAIIAETPAVSRPSSPRSLPVEIRPGRASSFKGRGFREETSRHTTPKTSAANSRTNSPPRRRTNSLSKIDKMAQAATLQPLIHTLSRPHSPRNFLKENIEEIRELSELNREKHEAEAERRKIEEEEALLKEMGLLDKNAKSDAIRSVVCSRTTSRSNSPNKISLRSRSNSPSAILHFENIPAGSKEYINQDDGMPKPVTHKSRLRPVSRSQPQSNDGSPKHSSKIPKRQNSVSPSRRDNSNSRYPENSLNKNQRFISNSTSSIHETIKVGSQVHDKRAMSKSTQFLNIAPTHIKGKPPISPGRSGPPPSNKSINAKRLSPIVGTPNKSPTDDLKPSSAKTSAKPSPVARKTVKTAGNTPATSRLNSRQPSRTVSRDPSPEKRKINNARVTSTSKPVTKMPIKPITRTPSTRSTQKPVTTSKPEPKKPMNRTNSMKSLTRTPSTKTLNEKPPLLKKRDSKKDLTEKSQSTNKINEVGIKKDDKKPIKSAKKEKDIQNKDDGKKKEKAQTKKGIDSCTGEDEVTKQDNETQYDKITNEKGELVILTKKSVVSMTTAAITSQPLEVVTTVTNQLPAALEKAREKGIFERLSSKESLAPKDEGKEDENTKSESKEIAEKPKEKEKEKDKEKEKNKDKEKDKENDKQQDKEMAEKVDDKKHNKHAKTPAAIFAEDNIKMKLLQPPYNNPQVEKVRQKIENILKEPEVSTENILAVSPKTANETKSTLKNVADKTKTDIKETKDEIANKLTDIKNEVVKRNDKTAAEIRSEASKIVDSIMTPVEQPKPKEVEKKEPKKDVEPIVVVVNEKKRNGPTETEKVTETLVKGEPEVEVQSSNLSTPGAEMMALHKPADGSGSDKSTHSNGGFPQSTSTTPKPPARANRKQSKEDNTQSSKEVTPEADDGKKKPNICSRLMGKCKKCCPCCVKGESDGEGDIEAPPEKRGTMSKLNCCKKKDKDAEDNDVDIEKAAGKAATIQFESETKRKRKLRDVLCGCCGSKRRISDVSDVAARNVAEMASSPEVVSTGCCGKRRHEIERRDSILSDRPPANCCTRMCTWMRGACRRHSEQSSSRRTSMFSKNKSLSPTLPPEDTRKKLDTSLVEHTSVMRGAIPVLPAVLAYFCLFCNIIVPGLGTILSGMFCLCFGIPRFGVHDGAKHRIGSFVINLLVGCGQLFTVLFCLVGWGWSIWWGVIFVKVSRKYRKLKAEEAAEEAEAAPPVTANNHART